MCGRGEESACDCRLDDLCGVVRFLFIAYSRIRASIYIPYGKEKTPSHYSLSHLSIAYSRSRSSIDNDGRTHPPSRWRPLAFVGLGRVRPHPARQRLQGRQLLTQPLVLRLFG